MNESKYKLLEELISQGESLTISTYKKPIENPMSGQIFKYSTTNIVDNPKEYWQWVEDVRCYIKSYYSSDFLVFNEILGNLNKHDTIIAKLIAIKKMNPAKEIDSQTDCYKIFISHSSKDKNIIEYFTDNILRLGVGILQEDIFCTSIEGMDIKTGEDIRKHIKKNLKYCDYVFLMISKNYSDSVVCLNEMGAAWALDKEVKPFLLPKTTIEDLGWIYNPTIASKIEEKATLNSLYDVLCEKYSITKNTTNWGRQVEKFLKSINNNFDNGELPKSHSIDSELSEFYIQNLKYWVKANDNKFINYRNASNGFSIYEFGGQRYNVKNAKEQADWEDFFEKLLELNFIEFERNNQFGLPIYKLKKAAFDFVKQLPCPHYDTNTEPAKLCQIIENPLRNKPTKSLFEQLQNF
jgi:hypothetical protein